MLLSIVPHALLGGGNTMSTLWRNQASRIWHLTDAVWRQGLNRRNVGRPAICLDISLQAWGTMACIFKGRLMAATDGKYLPAISRRFTGLCAVGSGVSRGSTSRTVQRDSYREARIGETTSVREQTYSHAICEADPIWSSERHGLIEVEGLSRWGDRRTHSGNKQDPVATIFSRTLMGTTIQ